MAATAREAQLKEREKMKSKKTEYIVLGALVGAALAIVLAIVIVTVVPARSKYDNNKVEKYDLDCVTQLKKNPLAECKE